MWQVDPGSTIPSSLLQEIGDQYKSLHNLAQENSRTRTIEACRGGDHEIFRKRDRWEQNSGFSGGP